MGYFGTLVGPVANRLAGARAAIAGRDYAFAPNDGANLLHGGRDGIQTRLWTIAEAGATPRPPHPCADGWRGRLPRRTARSPPTTGPRARPSRSRLTATTDAPTLMNLAHHGYWNPDGAPTTRGLRLTVHADRYLPVDAALIPLGEVRPVHDAFDLRRGRVLDLTEGLDHNFCLATAPRALTEVATLAGKSATLHLATTEPGLQIYEGARIAHRAVPGPRRYALWRLRGPRDGTAALARRAAPPRPSRAITLDPGETYRQTTRWRFTR